MTHFPSLRAVAFAAFLLLPGCLKAPLAADCTGLQLEGSHAFVDPENGHAALDSTVRLTKESTGRAPVVRLVEWHSAGVHVRDASTGELVPGRGMLAPVYQEGHDGPRLPTVDVTSWHPHVLKAGWGGSWSVERDKEYAVIVTYVSVPAAATGEVCEVDLTTSSIVRA